MGLDKYDIVIGDDCEALYKNGKLIVAAVKLSMGDILENCDICCDLWEGDLAVYTSPETFPAVIEDVITDEDERYV